MLEVSDKDFKAAIEIMLNNVKKKYVHNDWKDKKSQQRNRNYKNNNYRTEKYNI